MTFEDKFSRCIILCKWLLVVLVGHKMINRAFANFEPSPSGAEKGQAPRDQCGGED